jgi:hypothetical protein
MDPECLGHSVIVVILSVIIAAIVCQLKKYQ